MEAKTDRSPGCSRSRTVWILLGLFAALAVIDSALAKSAIVVPFNMAVWGAINGLRLNMPWLAVPMIVVTCLGSDPVLSVFVIALSIVWLRLNRRNDAVWLILISIFGLITGQAAKALVHSPRPLLIPPPSPLLAFSGYGFPSGHALMSAVVLGSAALILVPYAKTKAGRNIAVLICVILILAIGVSRIYLGAHWANDVVGGYLYGACILIAASLLRGRYGTGGRR